jgi:hypothetical protein
MSKLQEVEGHLLYETEVNRLAILAEVNGIPLKDVLGLFTAVSAAGGYETSAHETIDGVEAVLGAGWRKV